MQALRQSLSEQGLEALLVTRAENRFYISGFRGSAGTVIVTLERALLVTDFRYEEQAAQQARGFEVVKHGPRMVDTIAEILASAGVRRLGYEKEGLNCKEYELFRDRLAPVEMVGTEGLIEALRAVKSATEIEAIRRAAGIAAAAYSEVLALIRPGVREADLALEFDYLMRKKGAEGSAFETIVASGPRSSLPHARPGERTLQRGDLVVLDFGARVGGYCSDATRTVVIGRPDERQREIYELVLGAQEAALAALRAGLSGAEVDAVARDIIARAGHGEHFGHGLGHGVGIEVHEGPRLSSAGDQPLVAGNVVTVEPGVYLPGWGGVRIEDLVVVTEAGCEIFSPIVKELVAID